MRLAGESHQRYRHAHGRIADVRLALGDGDGVGAFSHCFSPMFPGLPFSGT